jgi:hypothetical protein
MAATKLGSTCGLAVGLLAARAFIGTLATFLLSVFREKFNRELFRLPTVEEYVLVMQRTASRDTVKNLSVKKLYVKKICAVRYWYR